MDHSAPLRASTLIATFTKVRGMRHQSILMWIKVHFYQNTFTGLEFSNIKIFNQKIHFF